MDEAKEIGALVEQAEWHDTARAIKKLASLARGLLEEKRELERHVCYDNDGKFVGVHRWATYHEYPNPYSTDASPAPRKVWCPACAVIKVQPIRPIVESTEVQSLNERIASLERQIASYEGMDRAVDHYQEEVRRLERELEEARKK